jgi:hypothetical protein
MTRTLATELFREMVSRLAEEVDLAAAALLIALDEYPDLNLQEYLLKLDQLAEGIRPELQRSGSVSERPVDAIEKMNQHLFAVEGFRGNREDYYDPRNSFLNEVLDRRTGIPITLSVIYMEVGKRLGLELQGVGMPGISSSSAVIATSRSLLIRSTSVKSCWKPIVRRRWLRFMEKTFGSTALTWTRSTTTKSSLEC